MFVYNWSQVIFSTNVQRKCNALGVNKTNCCCLRLTQNQNESNDFARSCGYFSSWKMCRIIFSPKRPANTKKRFSRFVSANLILKHKNHTTVKRDVSCEHSDSIHLRGSKLQMRLT